MLWKKALSLSTAALLFILVACAAPVLTSTLEPECAPAACPTDIQPEPAAEPLSSRLSPSERVPRITIEELLQKIESKADILIVDTRADVEEQFAVGRIKGAVPAPLSKITAGQWIPSADKEIILYCT